MSRQIAQHFRRQADRASKTYRFKREKMSAELCRCEACGWQEPAAISRRYRSVVQAHHVIPVACGGSDADDNLVLLCPNHHAIAHRVGQVTSGTGRKRYHGPQTKAELLGLLAQIELAPELAIPVLEKIQADAEQVRSAFLHQPYRKRNAVTPRVDRKRLDTTGDTTNAD